MCRFSVSPVIRAMYLLIFCFGGILGSFLTLLVVLYWQSLVERIWLPPAKRHENVKLIELDVLDADNPKVWLGCLFQFLFAELKDAEKVQKWFREKLIIEVEELKEKLPTRFVKDIRLNKFGLGTQPPIISNVKLCCWKTNQSKDIVEEVAVRFDLRYTGEFHVSLDVSLPIGQDAFVFIRLRQLAGNLEARFSRQPFTHWSISFTEEPQIVLDAVTQVHGRAVPQLANIIVAKIKRNIRRRHVLPNFRIRFPPFFPKPMGTHSSSILTNLSTIFDSSKCKTADGQPLSLDICVAGFSRLPQSVEPSAVLFFTLTCDSVPLTKQFSHVESFVVSITDPNEAIGILFVPSVVYFDGFDPASRKFSVFQGFHIYAVVADSPAQRAGIKPGGILVAVDGVTLGPSSTNLDHLLRKAAYNCKNGTIRLDICNIESPVCQLIPFCEVNSSTPCRENLTPLSASTGNIDKSSNDSSPSNPQEIVPAEEALPDSLLTANINTPSPNATLRSRHRKNLSTCSVSTTPELGHRSPAISQVIHSLTLEELNSQHISRSSSDTNIPSQETSSETRHGTLLSPLSASKAFSTMPKDLNFLAEKQFQQATILPPPVEDCVVLRYNPSEEQEQDQQEIVVGDVYWTKLMPYPANNGVSASLNEKFPFTLPPSSDETLKAFLNVVAWIGVPDSQQSINSENGGPIKWNRLHALGYAAFDVMTVMDELSDSGKMSSDYVKRTINFRPFVPVAPIIFGDGVVPGDANNPCKVQPPFSTQRGFSPELCFGDISLGFALANGQKSAPQDRPPFTIYRQVDDNSNTLRPQDQPGQIRSNASLKGMTEKLKMMRETCEHELVVAVSSRSQPCTICSKSLGILQRLSKSHAPLTCLRCGLLCHPRCAPKNAKTSNNNKDQQKTSPSQKHVHSQPSESDSIESFSLSSTLPTSISSSALAPASSNESLAISASPQPPSSNGVMSKWTSRAKKIVAVAREKEQKIVAKAGPRITQKWRDLKSKRPFQSVPSSASLQNFPTEYENVEVGEDVDSLLAFTVPTDNASNSDAVVAEDLIRAWAAKAAESPGAALEGSLAEALLSNGESDALLFQLKNLGKELFADLEFEERRQRLDAVISRLTDQLDEESERHAELKTQVKIARSQEATTSGNNSLMKKFKQRAVQQSEQEGSPVVHADQASVPKRERAVNLTAVHIGAVSSQAELSEKTLRIQNKRLTERLELSQRTADALRRRAEQLEERKAADDTLLFALSSNWSRLDEELRVLLQRFDQEKESTTTTNGRTTNNNGTANADENSNQANESGSVELLPHVDVFSEATESAQTFLGVLSSGDHEEMDQRLDQRVCVTTETVSRLLTAFDRLIQRQDRLAALVSKQSGDSVSNEITSLLSENARLQQLCTKLQSERHVAESQATRMGDRLAVTEARLSELQVRADDLTEALNGANRNIIKLDRELGEWKAREAAREAADGDTVANKVNEQATNSPTNTADELNEMRELAAERLAELQQVHSKLTDALSQLERAKAESNENIEKAAAATPVSTAELDSTRNQLAAVKLELMEIRNAMDEARLQQALQSAQKQRLLEQAEGQEISVQKDLRDALDSSNARLSTTLAELEQSRSCYEQLRIAHEQTVTAAREMRALIESLRTYYAQLKRELVRVRQQNQQKEVSSTANTNLGDTIASPTPSTSSGAANSTPIPVTPQSLKSPTQGSLCGTDCSFKQQLTSARQREESLVNELTVTTQAYEEMQEQSIRLTELVRQKDEAALRLVEERSDALKVVRLLRDEKDTLVEQVDLLQAQLDAQQHLCHRLEEKDQQLQSAFQSAEREAAIRAQALEAQRRRAADLALKLNETSASIDRYQRQSKEAQSLLGEKAVMVEKLLYQQRRGQEEVASLNRRLERLRRFEQMSAPADEVVAEELREYKELLACPICKIRQKDAVLTKCSHLFCMNCLRTRYETRQRKCPKCNAMFGANDFKRVFF